LLIAGQAGIAPWTSGLEGLERKQQRKTDARERHSEEAGIMRIINAKFERFSEVSVDTLLRSVGVYVLWSDRVVVRPSYIGEGTVLERLAAHAKKGRKFPMPWGGTVALLGKRGDKRAKKAAEALEALLLFCANEAARFPAQNRAIGKLVAAERIVSAHGLLRVNVSGQDPLLPPERPRMKSNKKIAIRRSKQTQGGFDVLVPWKQRPR
jgi:hypothetical protein